VTFICVPIFVESIEQTLSMAAEARDAGADLVEYRLDTFYSGRDDARELPAVLGLIAKSPLACIATCRPVLEGGQYDGPDDARVSLYEALGTAHGPGQLAPTYIDCEFSTYARSANIKQKVNLAIDHPGQLRTVTARLILSYHDFHTRPPDLFRTLDAMSAEPAAAVVKVAYRARSLRDNLELLDLAQQSPRPTIALGMGPFGLMSRVLAPKFGAMLTFAALRRDAQTAPGQPVLSELVQNYRFKAINPQTRLYGVVGWPVEHSLSPLIHNAGFEHAGHDGVYLPLPVAPDFVSLKATLLDLIEHPRLDFCGVSVTIPHKEHLVQLARERQEAGDDRWHLDRLSTLCGAANTVKVTRAPDGRATRIDLANTDAPAAVSALRSLTGELGGRTVLLLGAGGTARALACELSLDGAQVLLLARTKPRADELATDLARSLAGLGLAGSRAPRVIDTLDDQTARDLAAVVNCTPLGMAGGPGPDQVPLDEPQLALLSPQCVVADCVYRPIDTPLLKLARHLGLRTLDGVAMFVGQAAGQFSMWTGLPAPRGLFDRVVRETLEGAAGT
jgi:3-dehydroquinate dehydratase/shikimate dehydrogenase